MLYLLDANVLIDANRDYYPLNRVPEFWDWLINMGERGLVKIPIETYGEIEVGTDELAVWAKERYVRDALKFEEEVKIELVRQVISDGYANDLDDIELSKLGKDPLLISYALVDPGSRCIVTTEKSRPKSVRSNRHVPDVCKDCGIIALHTFNLISELNFSTNWKANL